MASTSEPFDHSRRPASKTEQPTPAAVRRPSRRRAKDTAHPDVRSNDRPDVILVGCGTLALESFVPALRTLQQAGSLHVRAIVDPDENSRDSCRRTLPDALPLSSLDAAVAPPDTLVIIATPARFHAAQTNAALKRGWHVLCANPFATTAREGALMIASAQRHERLLAVDLTPRFFPAARYLRTLCQDHLLGPPINFRIHEGTTRRIPEGALPASEKFESPDGVLTELGLPVLDLLTWCLGRASVISYSDDAMGGVEANAFIELSFSENARGTIHLSRDWPTEQACTFVFERGIVRWDTTHPGGLTFQLGSAPSAVHGELVAPLSLRQIPSTDPLLATPTHAMVAELQNTLGAITRRETLRVPATEAMHSLALVEECYARRASLLQPWLPRNEAVQARAFSPPVALRRS